MRLLFLITLGFATSTKGQQLDILAFDFYRKFGHYAHLGECADVSRPVENSNTSEIIRCHFKQNGVENFQESEILHETIIEVTSLNDVISHLGLCDGNAVSRLGLLYNSECITVDIAKSISLDEKTYNRAFFGTYRRGLVLLNQVAAQEDSTIAPSQLEDKFFTKYITYGTKEMILLSVKYKSERDARSSKQIEFVSEDLAGQLSKLLRETSNIENIQIARLSTADRIYNTWNFPPEIAYEAVTRLTNEKTQTGEVTQRVLSDIAMDPYYMGYVMWPFLRTPSPAGKDMLWQNITVCEIKLHNVAKFGKQAFEEKCVGVLLSNKYCKRLRRRLKRVSRIIDRDVHEERSTWYQMTSEEKETAVRKCSRVSAVNEHKMDRSVNRLLFDSAPEPSVGESRSRHSRRLKKGSNKKLGKKGKGRRKKKDDKRKRRKYKELQRSDEKKYKHLRRAIARLDKARI